MCFAPLLDRPYLIYIRFFCHESTAEGFASHYLEDLLSVRKQAKADLRKEMNPFKWAVLDGRQLALKVSVIYYYLAPHYIRY